MKAVVVMTMTIWLFSLAFAIMSIFIILEGDLTMQFLAGVIFNAVNLIVLTLFNILAIKELKRNKEDGNANT